MKKYICTRLMTAIPVLVGISILAFVLGILSPGDPAEFALNQNGFDAPTVEQIAAMRESLGLNRSVLVQYFDWLVNILQGDFGVSYITGRNIAAEIMHRLPVTLKLACISLLVASVGGIGLGVICAVYQDSWLDNAVKNISNVMLSIPGFWLALVLILLFCEKLRLLPTSGSSSFVHFILPATVLSFATMGTICRFVRGVMITEFGKQYFLVARVRGISSCKLILQYALPNAIVPVLALLGNYFAGVLGGSVIVENIFAIPGISSMALEAIKFRDYPVLQAYVLITGWTLVLISILVDVLICYINPKVKLGE